MMKMNKTNRFVMTDCGSAQSKIEQSSYSNPFNYEY